MPLIQPIDPTWRSTEAVPKFNDVYSAIASARYPIHDFYPARVHSGPIAPRRCALCDRDVQQGATFRSVSHIIPAALGNHRYLSNEECDGCNSLFSTTQDSELANFFAVQRLLHGVRGREGPFTIQPRGKKESRVGSLGPQHIGIWRDEGDLAIDFELLEGNRGRMGFDLPSFRPLRALQALLRSCWLLMDEAARTRTAHLLNWIKEAPPTPTSCLKYTLNNATFQFADLSLWERRSQVATADLILQFTFCDVVLIWSLPNLDGRRVPSVLPPFMIENQNPSASVLKIESPEAIARSVRAEWKFTYESKIELLPGSKPATPDWPKTLPPTGDVFVCVEKGGIASRALPAELTLMHQDSFRWRFRVGGRSFAGVFDVSVDSRLEDARLRLKLLPHLVSARDALATVELVMEASAGAKVSFRKNKDTPPFGRGELHADDSLQHLRLLLAALSAINAALGTEIRFPKANQDFDWELALETARIVETGRIGLGSGTLNATLDEPTTLENVSSKAGGSFSLLIEEPDVSVVVGGTRLSLGPRMTTFVPCQPLADALHIKGTTWSLAFESAVSEYPRWIGRRPDAV